MLNSVFSSHLFHLDLIMLKIGNPFLLQELPIFLMLGARWDCSQKRHCFSAMSLLLVWVCSQKKDIAFQRCLFVRLGLLTKKRHCFSAMSLLFVWVYSQKKDIAFQRCLFVRLGLLTKKRHCFSAMSLLGARWDSNP